MVTAMIEGFAHERMCVLPRPLVAEALSRPVTKRLLVTDAGWFPEARHHLRVRPGGAEETILLLCVAGAGWVEVDGLRHVLGPGTAALIPNGTPHSYGSADDSPWTIWWCHFRGTDLGDLLAATGLTRARPVTPLPSTERCVALLDEIVRSLERDQSPGRLLACSGAGWRLLTQIAVDRLLPERGDPLARAMDYLAERLDAGVRVADLAALVGVSPSHLSALFRATTGGGITAHHTALRMARARQLLDRTTLTVAEVGREVGYDDQFYFSRQFRRTHGVSPSGYRAHNKG